MEKQSEKTTLKDSQNSYTTREKEPQKTSRREIKEEKY